MFTGRLPFHGPTRNDVLRRQITAKIPRPSRFRGALPPAIDELLLRALAKDPDERPRDAAAFRRELTIAWGGERTVVESAAPSTWMRPLLCLRSSFAPAR